MDERTVGTSRETRGTSRADRPETPAAATRGGEVAGLPSELSARLSRALPALRRYALGLSRNPDDAADLVQETCLRALSSWEQWRPGTNFEAWLFRILHNLWIDRLRSGRARERLDTAYQDSAARHVDGQRVVDHRLTLSAVQALLETLPLEQREVVIKVAVEGLSYRDAAVALSAPIGTVMSRLSRARRLLQSEIGQPLARGLLLALLTPWLAGESRADDKPADDEPGDEPEADANPLQPPRSPFARPPFPLADPLAKALQGSHTASALLALVMIEPLLDQADLHQPVWDQQRDPARADGPDLVPDPAPDPGEASMLAFPGTPPADGAAAWGASGDASPGFTGPHPGAHPGAQPGAPSGFAEIPAAPSLPEPATSIDAEQRVADAGPPSGLAIDGPSDAPLPVPETSASETAAAFAPGEAAAPPAMPEQGNGLWPYFGPSGGPNGLPPLPGSDFLAGQSLHAARPPAHAGLAPGHAEPPGPQALHLQPAAAAAGKQAPEAFEAPQAAATPSSVSDHSPGEPVGAPIAIDELIDSRDDLAVLNGPPVERSSAETGAETPGAETPGSDDAVRSSPLGFPPQPDGLEGTNDVQADVS